MCRRGGLSAIRCPHGATLPGRQFILVCYLGGVDSYRILYGGAADEEMCKWGVEKWENWVKKVLIFANFLPGWRLLGYCSGTHFPLGGGDDCFGDND